MIEKTRKQITDENENHVCAWFEKSGFTGKRLDSRKGKKGGSADWKFTKPELGVICEVKTIFSAGQSGMTPEQNKRYRLELKRKFNHYKTQARKEGTTFIVHQSELEYFEGESSYSRRTLPKEDEFNNFLEDIRKQLRKDHEINQLPFSISISIGALYVAYRRERQHFVEWLKILFCGHINTTVSNELIPAVHLHSYLPIKKKKGHYKKKSKHLFK